MINTKKQVNTNLKEVALSFFKIIRESKPSTKSEFDKVYNKVEKLHKKGWTLNSIGNNFVTYRKKNGVDKNIKLDEIKLFNQVPPYYHKDNILEDKFYYNYFLHRRNEPPSLRIIPCEGIKKTVSEFYFEVIEYLTHKKLTEHVMKRLSIHKVLYEDTENKLFKLRKDFSLDEILFTVDFLYLQNEEIGVINAKVLPYYIEEGKNLLLEAHNCIEPVVHPYFKAYIKEREGKEEMQWQKIQKK